MKNRVLWLVALAVLGAVVSWCYHCRFISFQPAGVEVGPGRFTESLEALDLTAGQKARILVISDEYAAASRKGKEEIAIQRINLCGLLAEPDSSEENLEAKCKAISNMQYDQQRRLIKFLKRIKRVLTPEQQKAFFSAIRCELCRGFRMECAPGECLCGSCEVHEH